MTEILVEAIERALPHIKCYVERRSNEIKHHYYYEIPLAKTRLDLGWHFWHKCNFRIVSTKLINIKSFSFNILQQATAQVVLTLSAPVVQRKWLRCWDRVCNCGNVDCGVFWLFQSPVRRPDCVVFNIILCHYAVICIRQVESHDPGRLQSHH